MALACPPPKKKAKRTTLYRAEMTETFPCLVKSSKGANYVHCSICFKDFSIDSGMNDCTRHVEGPRHKQNAKSVSSSQSMLSFANSSSNSLQEAVTRAEVLFSGFLVEHNIPLSAADHASKLFKAMFMSSPQHSAADIIKKYSCARTKTTHIVNEMAGTNRQGLIEIMRTSPFCLATDASNDRMEKLFPIVVRTVRDGEVKTDLLSIVEVHGKCTGKNIADALRKDLEEKGIPLLNCIGFATDNANVMIGNKQGCYGNLLKEQPSLIATGCMCHRLHLAAEWAAKQLPVDVEQFLVDIYYYMEKSADRVQAFEEIQEECGVRKAHICKHVSTRWLSLRKSVDWVLEQWEPLEKFFSRECDGGATEARSIDASEHKHERKKKVLENLRSRTMKLYLKYLAYILPEFDRANLQMQIETPMVHVQRRLTMKFIRTLMQMLVKPCALVGGKLVTEVDYKSNYNILPNEQLMVGESAREQLKKVNTETKTNFFHVVKQFLTTAITYMLKHGKVNDDYLHHAEVADINLKETAMWRSIEYFLDKFPIFMPPGCSKDALQSEFSSYRSASLPSKLEGSIDKKWMQLADHVKDEVGAKCLLMLPTVMLHILAIPHSNASCERVFSLVRKNRTDFRASMSVQTLENLLILKQEGTVCHERSTTSSLLKACREATTKALSSAPN